MADLNELESLAKAASSGPWEVGDDGPILYEGMQRPVWNIYGGRNFVDARLVGSIEHFQGDDYPNANAAFIAAANPAVILDLIASARRDAEEIERLKLALESEKLNYDGALSDLESALQVLARRINGEKDLDSARTWLELNYPDFAASALTARAAHTGEG